MTINTDAAYENVILSEADLATCRPMRGEDGGVLRAFCPFHGSDQQRSLRVTLATGRFQCFACGAWGYLDEARQRWRDEQQRQSASGRLSAHRCSQPRPLRPAGPARPRPVPAAQRVPASSRPELTQQLAAFQDALPGSRGEAYLRQRGIPLTLAQQAGVGYAAPRTWSHAARDWKGGRLVFPHTDPEGHVVNLYGRAIGTAADVPKAKRHDHLPGEKGYFNATALREGGGPLFVCEGAFDALSLRAAGVSRVVAIFGVHGWRWAWAREVRELVFALDADAAGQQRWRELARQAVLRGKQVTVLPSAAYGGYNDVNEAWVAGVLALRGGPLPGAAGDVIPAVSAAFQERWEERVAIMMYEGHLPRAEAEHLAWVSLQRGEGGELSSLSSGECCT